MRSYLACLGGLRGKGDMWVICASFPLAAGKILWLFLSPALCEVVSGNSCLITSGNPRLKEMGGTSLEAHTKCKKLQVPGTGSMGTSLLAVQKSPFPSMGGFAHRPSCSGVGQGGTGRSGMRAQHTLLPARFGSREAQN